MNKITSGSILRSPRPHQEGSLKSWHPASYPTVAQHIPQRGAAEQNHTDVARQRWRRFLLHASQARSQLGPSAPLCAAAVRAPRHAAPPAPRCRAAPPLRGPRRAHVAPPRSRALEPRPALVQRGAAAALRARDVGGAVDVGLSVCLLRTSLPPSVRTSAPPCVRPSACPHIHPCVCLFICPSARPPCLPSIHGCPPDSIPGRPRFAVVAGDARMYHISRGLRRSGTGRWHLKTNNKFDTWGYRSPGITRFRG